MCHICSVQAYRSAILAVLHVQAQAHYPLVDVFAVSSYLDDLAAECRTRIAASDATTDLEKLAILNQLMFNPPADGRYVAHTSCHTQQASSGTLALPQTNIVHTTMVEGHLSCSASPLAN